MIEIPAVIRKADIVKTKVMMGKANREPYLLNGVTYNPGTLMFVTFAGRHTGNHIFQGVYRFQPVEPPMADCVLFNDLPDATAAVETTPLESEEEDNGS